MKRKHLVFLSSLLLVSFVMSSCMGNSVKSTDIKVRSKSQTGEETEPDETEDTSETEEASVVIIESGVYTDEDAPIEVNWDNYQPAEPVNNVFTRLSDDYISDFEPSSDYGAVFPFCFTSSQLYYPDPDPDDYYYDYYDPNDNFSDKYDNSFGFFDSHGRIVCDAVYTSAYPMSGFPLYIVGQGSVGDRKYGIINFEGTKKTDVEYIGISPDTDGYIYATTEKEFVVYDRDLNIVKRSTYKCNVDGEWTVWITHVLDDSHCLVTGEDFYGTVLLNYKSGELLECYMVDMDEKNKTILCYDDNWDLCVIDYDGNVLNDSLRSDDDVYREFDSQGNVTFELDVESRYNYRKIGDYLLLNIKGNKWTLFDKDRNEVGTYSCEYPPYIYGWYYDYDVSSAPVYVQDGLDFVNALTGEVLFQVYENGMTYVHVSDDLVVAESVDYDNDVVAVRASNGNGIVAFTTYNYELAYDMKTDTPYVILPEDNEITLYDLINDKTFSIDGEVAYLYTWVICDNVLYYQYGGVTYGFDISDPDNPQQIFRYTAVDPMGD